MRQSHSVKEEAKGTKAKKNTKMDFYSWRVVNTLQLLLIAHYKLFAVQKRSFTENYLPSTEKAVIDKISPSTYLFL